MSNKLAGIPIEIWIERFSQQFHWSYGTRRHIYRITQIGRMTKILDVGCGCGQITDEIARLTKAKVSGIDIEPEFIEIARKSYGSMVTFSVGDGCKMPFNDNEFDGVFCHLYLHWLKDSDAGVKEMSRVAKKGGVVCAMMEPDYGGWLMNPDNDKFKQNYINAIINAGHNPFIGRRLQQIFTEAVLKPEIWVYNYIRTKEDYLRDFEKEWKFNKAIFKTIEINNIRKDDINTWMENERKMIESGRFFSYIPFFYVISIKE
jgi:ubiquinone/menaquinone biosynthesis C-methylase UbiE